MKCLPQVEICYILQVHLRLRLVSLHKDHHGLKEVVNGAIGHTRTQLDLCTMSQKKLNGRGHQELKKTNLGEQPKVLVGLQLNQVMAGTQLTYQKKTEHGLEEICFLMKH